MLVRRLMAGQLAGCMAGRWLAARPESQVLCAARIVVGASRGRPAKSAAASSAARALLRASIQWQAVPLLLCNTTVRAAARIVVLS